MSTHTYFTLDVPEAATLKHLIGIDSDLRQVILWCDEYVSLYSARNTDAARLLTPMTTAMHVTLIRATGVGVRQQAAKGLLECLDDVQAERYQYFKDVRDKHIAHSVSDMEKNEVRAHYVLEDPNRGITSIGLGGQRISGMSPQDAEQMKDIAETLLEEVKRRISVEKVAIEAIAETIDPSEYDERASAKLGKNRAFNPSKARKD